jgi:hypothetical protein
VRVDLVKSDGMGESWWVWLEHAPAHIVERSGARAP